MARRIDVETYSNEHFDATFAAAHRYFLHPAPDRTGDHEVSPHRKGASSAVHTWS